MASWKKSCAVVAVVLAIGGGALAAAPAGAQSQVREAGLRSYPVADLTFVNDENNGQLGVRGSRLVADPDPQGLDIWVMQPPPGAPQGVLQIQRSGTNSCITATSSTQVVLADCANNPGRAQRWALDITPNQTTTIVSRQYPGQALTQVGESVRLDRLSDEDPNQLWHVYNS
ncbi:hypothetical protein [Streptomyces microflavus]|uniref:Ricin B lectin domain-containing protein n=1 Tax=Streptomyces microflavus TaxID=1919 RepID=A0ABV1QED9_STRMI